MSFPLPTHLGVVSEFLTSCNRYLFAGAWTILWSAVVYFVVPDSPETSHRWFNAEERALLEIRSRRAMVGARGRTAFNWSHAREAATDIKVYLYLLMGGAIYVRFACHLEKPDRR